MNKIKFLLTTLLILVWPAVSFADSTIKLSNVIESRITKRISLPKVTISADPTSITSNKTSVITWSSTNAAKCTTSWGAKALNGTYTTPPLTKTQNFSVVCMNQAGQESKKSIKVTVIPDPGTLPVPTVAVSANPASIEYNAKTTLTWSSTNATSCATPWESTATSGTYTTPSLTTSTSYSISCSNATSLRSALVNISVAPAPPPPSVPTVTLTADPTSIGFGETTRLSWSSTNANSCSAKWDSGPLANNGIYTTPVLQTNTSFSITCSNPLSSATASVNITVGAITPPPAPTVTLTATPSTVVYNGTSTLTWSSINATTCTTPWGTPWESIKVQSAGGVTSGSYITPALTTNTTYTVSCTGPGGSKSATASIIVMPASNVVWTKVANEYESFEISGTQTVRFGKGSQWVEKQVTKGGICAEYFFNQGDPAPNIVKQCDVKSNVQPIPAVTLTANPTSISYNGTSTLTWSSTNATSCSANWKINSNVLPITGTYTTPALTTNTSYTISCSNILSSATASVNITVASQQTPTPTVTLTANPTSIAYNGTSTLTWSSTNATSCTTPWGSTATSGNYTTPALSATTTYTVICTGGGGAKSASVNITVAPQTPPTPGSGVTTLSVTATMAGTFPYVATVLPLQGQVQSGQTLQSPDDATMKASILSTWNDGSAAVVVVAGNTSVTTNQQKSLRIQTKASVTETALTAARISELVTNVTVDFGAGLGVARVTNFSNPQRVWWSNPQTICARYRASAPGHATLEAIIDIQAFASNRALVEIVVENARMNSTTPVGPASASYTAIASVNGNTIANVSSSNGPEASHTAFRAWYASTWIGSDPGLRVTELHTDLQKHPLLFKIEQTSNVDMALYDGDTYTPWGSGRQRRSGMGNGGDHESIGPLTQWDSRFLQSGDARAAKAVEANALVVLGWNINYRDTSTQLVPDFNQLVGKSMQINWPVNWGNNTVMTWETAHHPAEGLMAFIARPSPVYIEIAQKIAVWNGTWSTYGGTPTGVFGQYYQTRGRAWGIRSLTHAIFLTPDSLAWKSAAKTSLNNNVTYLNGWKNSNKAILNAMWEDTPTILSDAATNRPGFQTAMWYQHYLTTELHKIASAKILTGSDQTTLNALADWNALQPVRWINEQANGGWRYVSYKETIGRNAFTIDSLPDYGQQAAWNYTDTPPTVSGSWMSFGNNKADTFSQFGPDNTAGAYYPSYLWSALVAAVERNLPGAATAWQTVQSNVTNLSSWKNGFASDPRWGSTPRVTVPTSGFGNGSNAGSIAGNLWTPGRDTNGLVNAVSVALLQPAKFYEVANSNLSQLETAIQAAIPGWRDNGVSKWDGVTDAWVGMAYDTRNGYERAWIGPGGGHSGSTNNGLYRFDIRKFLWNIEKLPTDSAIFPAGYTGDTVYPPATTAYNANPTGPIGYDEIYDPAYPNDPVRSSRMPSPRHTYASLVFAPDLGTQGSLLMGCRRQWKFDIAQNKWAAPVNMNGATDMLLFSSAENMMAWWDEVTQRYYHQGNNASNSGADRNYWWHPASNTWGNDSRFMNYGWMATDGSFERIGRKVYQLTMKPYPDGRPGWPWQMNSLDLDTGAVTRQLVTLGTSFNGLTFANGPGSGYWDTPGMTFIAPLNKWLTVVNTIQRGQEWAWIDPTTWIVELATDIQGARSGIYNLENKIKYFPDTGLVVWFGSGTKNIKVLRVN